MHPISEGELTVNGTNKATERPAYAVFGRKILAIFQSF